MENTIELAAEFIRRLYSHPMIIGMIDSMKKENSDAGL